ncbi:hypothetical protein PsYK624_138840 [Phanerochaete sordida]|uniref:Uncharacterized protein n=1 Tax=Phanerochaete sordida TaxID=48140 RepID=A0A9P3LJR7_9APHY|nr:hypothetical protein PsYK624_138840 [Phanerochaete sordida]
MLDLPVRLFSAGHEFASCTEDLSPSSSGRVRRIGLLLVKLSRGSVIPPLAWKARRHRYLRKRCFSDHNLLRVFCTRS